MQALKLTTVELTVRDLGNIHAVLQYTHKQNADGTPVMQSYSTKQLSGVRWFQKHAFPVIDAHNAKVKAFEDAVRAEFQEEMEENAKQIQELQKKMAALTSDNKGEDAGSVSDDIAERMKRQQELASLPRKRAMEEQELKDSYSVVKHPIQMGEVTIDAINYAFENREFSAEDVHVVDILDAINNAA